MDERELGRLCELFEKAAQPEPRSRAEGWQEWREARRSAIAAADRLLVGRLLSELVRERGRARALRGVLEARMAPAEVLKDTREPVASCAQCKLWVTSDLTTALVSPAAGFASEEEG